MDRRIETFLQAAACGSFSETARKLFISQPAVTQQIASLGDELGVRLFERVGNRMELTEPGRIAHGHYLRMRSEEQALAQELAPWSTRRSFVVGCPSGMIEYDIERYSRVLQSAMQCFPDAEVHSVELTSPRQHFRALANHEADVTISAIEPMRAVHGEAIGYRALRSIRHYVVCRRDSAFAQKALVRLADLAGQVVYTFESEAFPDELLHAFAELDDPKPLLRHQQSLAGVLPLIQAGKGVTVYAQRIKLPDDLTLVPLDFAPNVHVGLVWLKDAQPQTQAFLGFVNHVFDLYLEDRAHEKAFRRTQMRLARASMGDDERDRQSTIVCTKLLELNKVRKANVVACYLAQNDELDLSPFMQALQRANGEARKEAKTNRPAIVLPVTLRGPQLAFVRVVEEEIVGSKQLPSCLSNVTHAFEEVPPELAGRVVDPADIDVVVLPGLAFDRRGTRLGYGGGYYDAWLGGLQKTPHRPCLIGVCFDCQLLPPGATLPREPHDIAMDTILTPSEAVLPSLQA